MRILLILSSMIFLLSACQNNAAQIAQAHSAYVQKEYQESVNHLLPLAHAGDAKAQYALGFMYFYGQGVKRDIDTAKKWIRASAEQGNVSARRALNMITQSDAAYSSLG